MNSATASTIFLSHTFSHLIHSPTQPSSSSSSFSFPLSLQEGRFRFRYHYLLIFFFLLSFFLSFFLQLKIVSRSILTIWLPIFMGTLNLLNPTLLLPLSSLYILLRLLILNLYSKGFSFLHIFSLVFKINFQFHL